MSSFTSRASLAALSLLATTSLGFAHAGISPTEAPLGQTIRVAIIIPHGCDGAATDTLSVSIPEGFVAAQPQAKAGWTIETTTGAYARTYSVHGSDVTSGTRSIRWSGGSLPDTQFDDFVFQGSIQGLEPGTQLAFPVTQSCGSTEILWDQLAETGQDPHSLPHPAPAITVAQAAPGANEHAHSAGMDMSAATTLGDLEITGAFTRATLPNAPVGGGYFTITNTGTEPDRLIAAHSPVAGQVQVHQMALVDGVMRMGELPDGLEIPPGHSVSLAPGGLHLMFMGITQAFTEGETVPVTLTFEKAGTIDIQLPVGGIAADAPAHDMNSMEGMSHE
jgi:periplasmic copper chaperone A